LSNNKAFVGFETGFVSGLVEKTLDLDVYTLASMGRGWYISPVTHSQLELTENTCNLSLTNISRCKTVSAARNIPCAVRQLLVNEDTTCL